MIIRIEIGEAQHPPIGAPLYPVFNSTGYSGKNGPYFITREQMLEIKDRIEHLFLVCKEYDKALRNASEN